MTILPVAMLVLQIVTALDILRQKNFQIHIVTLDSGQGYRRHITSNFEVSHFDPSLV